MSLSPFRGSALCPPSWPVRKEPVFRAFVDDPGSSMATFQDPLHARVADALAGLGDGGATPLDVAALTRTYLEASRSYDVTMSPAVLP